MLRSVQVKNLALIEETEIELNSGLNIITGETGAGKSIIIGSINYCLGAKASKDVIREGADYALVELVFQVLNEELCERIKKLDFSIEDDGTIILSRKIMPERSVFKVNGENVTAKQMKELASILIDIHGQHEHQSLLTEKNQAIILDKFAPEELRTIKQEIAEKYCKYRELKKKLDELSIDDASREREIGLARFEIDEIENVGLVANEDIALNEKYRKTSGMLKSVEALNSAYDCLEGDSTSATDLVSEAVGRLQECKNNSDELDNIYSMAVDAETVLNDLSHGIRRLLDEMDYDEEEFDRIEERINLINHLELKYGGTISSVLEYLDERKKHLVELENISDTTNDIKKRICILSSEIEALCKKAHDIRVKEAKKLSKDISLVLEDLNFLKVNFEIVVSKKDSFGPDGYDEVVFMISLNPGEKLRAISEVASGGELSRIMLAIKTVLAKQDEIETLIFDEIDTGISGITAWKVSERMGELSRKHQVICITHLPQIAAMADTHYLIAKEERNSKTVTDITLLQEEDTIYELARLLGSDEVSEAVKLNAKELKEKAKEAKNSCA